MLYLFIFLGILAFIASVWFLAGLLWSDDGWMVALGFVLIALFFTGVVGFLMAHKDSCSFINSKYCTSQGIMKL
jgi:hypothetical protein